MSDFLEHVLQNSPTAKKPIHRPRAGLVGSARRYALMLTLMAGLTAVPSWIILKAGVNGLDGSATAPAQPLLLPASPAKQEDPAPPVPRVPREPAKPEVPMPVMPVDPPDNPPKPILERQAVVDTPDRPMRKKQSPPPTSPPPTSAPAPSRPAKLLPSGLPSMRDLPRRPHLPQKPRGADWLPEKPRGADWPNVERPDIEWPDVEWPKVERPQQPQVIPPAT